MQPLVTLAIANSHADITRFCFNHGAVFDKHAIHATERCQKTERMLDTLIAVNWVDLKNYTEAARGLGYRHENSALTHMRWMLKYSGWAAERPPNPLDGNFTLPVVKLLVREIGIGIMRNTGTLQLAALLGDKGLVRFLLDSGAEIDERPAPLDERESGPSTALQEALFARNFEIAQILLDHDATIMDGTLQHYRNKGDTEVVEILERELEKRASFPLIRV
jgi:hypothetical protein